MSNTANIRHRKKRKYNTLREQMEFYFSDANLRRDRFMKDLHERFNGEIPLREFLIFNCIKNITTSTDDLIKAIEKSNELICNKYRKTVKRANDIIKIKEDVDDYMIYVESIPSSVDIKWLQKTFITFGKIDHISLPRFKITNQIKEFAFIEFHNKISVSKAIKYFKTFDGIIDCDNENIQNLYSIKTYGDEEGHTLDTLHAMREIKKKIKSETITSGVSSCKKICLGTDEDDIKRLIDCKKYYNKDLCNEEEDKETSSDIKMEINQDVKPKLENVIEDKEKKIILNKNESNVDDEDDEDGYCCDEENCNHGEEEEDDDDGEYEDEEGEEEDEEEEEEEEEDDDDEGNYDDMTDDEDVAIAEADEADLIGEANVADDISSSYVNRYPNNDEDVHDYNIAKYDNIKDVSNLLNTIRSKNYDCLPKMSQPGMANILNVGEGEQASKMSAITDYADEKKRLRRKRKFKKLKKPTVASIQDLRIMTKKEWKRLRNVYLNLQRDLKKNTIRKPTLSSYPQVHHNVPRMPPISRFYKPHLPLLLPPPVPLPSQSQIMLHKPKHFYKPLLLPPPPPLTSRTSPYTDKKIINEFIKPISPLVGFSKSAGYSVAKQSNELTDVKFVPNVILYLQFAEPCTNVKDFKETLRAKNKETIRYIDVKEGDPHAYIRLTDSKHVCDVLQGLDLPCKLLSGNDELEYWMKINKDRKDKITKNIRVKKEKKPFIKTIKIQSNIINNTINNNNNNNNSSNMNKQRNNRKNRRQMKIQKNKHIYFE